MLLTDSEHGHCGFQQDLSKQAVVHSLFRLPASISAQSKK